MVRKNNRSEKDKMAGDSSTPLGQPPGRAGHDEQLMTTRELMEFLNLSRTKIWELVTKKGLPAFKIGGDYRYRRSEVLSWLERYRVQGGKEEES